LESTNERHNNSSKTMKTELKSTHLDGWEDLKLKAHAVVSHILFGVRAFSYRGVTIVARTTAGFNYPLVFKLSNSPAMSRNNKKNMPRK